MGHKNFKKGDKLGQGVGVLKRGGWNPLTNYALILGICDVTLRFCFYIFTAISFPRASDCACFKFIMHFNLYFRNLLTKSHIKPIY